jgi:hypothetical protein
MALRAERHSSVNPKGDAASTNGDIARRGAPNESAEEDPG